MGYAKYREDIERIADERRPDLGKLNSAKSTDIHYFDCKYCNRIFTSRNDLFQHIKCEHNIVRPIIMINDKVAGDNTIVQHINSAKIILYGFSNEIIIDDETLQGDENSDGELDITEKLNHILTQKNNCEIRFQSDTVTIHKQAFKIENQEIIKNAISDWEKSISQGDKLSEKYLTYVNGGDKLFLEGVYNYYLACCATHDKVRRYDEAFSLLSRFDDMPAVGKCILKVILFRRNWISRLCVLSNNMDDAFSVACDYYNRKYREYHFNNNGVLFVETDTLDSLEMILLYQQGKYDIIKERLSTISDLDDVEDLNYMDQLNLICARLNVIYGNKRRANEHYEKIITPFFKEEYKLFRQLSLPKMRELLINDK